MATSTLSYAYAQRTAWLDDLNSVDHPANHDLCDQHADRTNAPKGWDLRDRRSAPALVRLRYAG